MSGNRETEMMDVRWKVFKFHNRIPQHERKKIIFLLLDVLMDSFFLETLTDFICNICLK